MRKQTLLFTVLMHILSFLAHFGMVKTIQIISLTPSSYALGNHQPIFVTAKATTPKFSEEASPF